jgi:hypothetical protein
MIEPDAVRILPPGAGPDIDLHDTQYSALNCRAGIIAAILRHVHRVDVTPLFAHSAVTSTDTLPGMTAGDIAGLTCGNIPEETWGTLFGATLSTWRPADRADMLDSLSTALREDGMVLAPHDGYADPIAADKYRRHHILHNSLIYGRTPDGMLRIADRGHRALIRPEALWPAMDSPLSSFVVVRGARPFAGPWTELLAAGTRRFRRALSARLSPTDLEQMIAAVDADRQAPEGRALQTHFYLAAVGWSRTLFARFIRAASATGAAPAAEALVQRLEDGGAAWMVVSRFLYKRFAAGVRVGARELSTRVAPAERADADALALLDEQVARLVDHRLVGADGRARR